MKGFSLIELMVVIAIVALLAAIVTPVYFNYLTKSKFNTLVPIAEDLMNQSFQYYNAHNSFPAPSQIGYTGSASQYNPLLASIEGGVFASGSWWGGAQCNAMGWVRLTVDNSKFNDQNIQAGDNLLCFYGQKYGEDVIINGCSPLLGANGGAPPSPGSATDYISSEYNTGSLWPKLCP
jgi:prepilin-type N-terminal cleavage/methylation domain-containing protein